jgi:lysophospholipase L1-like esterase
MTDLKITHQMPEGTKTIACLGDSITAGACDEEGLGWTARLNQLFAQRKPMDYWVQSCGISGDTVIDAWHNLIGQVRHINPEILLIKIGVNDVCIREGIEPESFQVSRADRLNMWIKILTFAKANFEHVFVICPLPIETDLIRFKAWENDAAGQTSFRYEQETIQIYNDDIQNLCKKHEIPCLSLFKKWTSLSNLPDYYADGLHPNAKGHQLLAEDIFQFLKERGL